MAVQDLMSHQLSGDNFPKPLARTPPKLENLMDRTVSAFLGICLTKAWPATLGVRTLFFDWCQLISVGPRNVRLGNRHISNPLARMSPGLKA